MASSSGSDALVLKAHNRRRNKGQSDIEVEIRLFLGLLELLARGFHGDGGIFTQKLGNGDHEGEGDGVNDGQ